MVGLAAICLIMLTGPVAAFWPRSQWLACSEAAITADYRRWRCWELEGYAGEIAPGHPRFGMGEPAQRYYQPRRPRGIVSRLG